MRQDISVKNNNTILIPNEYLLFTKNFNICINEKLSKYSLLYLVSTW